MLFAVHRPNGGTGWCFRPDKPDPKNPGRKYEMPCKAYGAPGNVLDVHPSARPLLEDTTVPVVFTEGVKKAYSITSAVRREGTDIVAVAISGVWNWLSGGEAIPDMYDVPVDKRKVFICFDSDMLRNPDVQMAAERLAGWLGPRGAKVRVVYLPDQPDGSKNGADDFLAGGGTLCEMLALARPFDPDDLRREKLSRNERLRRGLEDLRRQHDGMPSKSRGECSRRAAWRACIAQAERSGKPVGDGVEVRIAARTGAELGAMSHMTFARKMNELVEAGRVRRVKSGRNEDADSYVLLTGRALLLHNEEKQGKSAGKSSNEGGAHHGVTEPRAPETPQFEAVPELRWPYVAARQDKDEAGRPVDVYEYVARLGKKRGEFVRHLLDRGGSSTVPELMRKFAGPNTRPRDFKSRQLADLAGFRRQHRGTPLSVGPPIIEIEGDVVRLLPDWRDALEKHRELAGEIDHTDPVTGKPVPGADTLQKINHLRQRAGFRAHLAGKNPPDVAPTEEEMEERRKRRRRDRAAMVADALMALFAEDSANRDLYPDRMAEAVARLLPDGFPRNAAPYGKPKPEEVVEFLENHALPVPAPIYDRFDRDAEARFRAWERAARRSGKRDSPKPVVEPSPMKRRRLTFEEAEEVKRLMAALNLTAAEARSSVLGEGVAS
jgi:hypothetical protein